MPPETTEGPAVVVEIHPGRASAETVIGAVDAALASELAGIGVRVPLDERDSRHETFAHLCGGDPRVEIAPAHAPPAASEVVCTMPAHARPAPRTLPALVTMAREQGLASVDAPVPPRLGRGGRLRVTAGGSGTRRVRAAVVGLRWPRSRGVPGPPPPGDLATERAEHLRRRARSSTMRARLDRIQHRLARERLQMRHARAWSRLAEEHLGRTGPAEWIKWRGRVVGRRVAALPGIAFSATRTARAFGRRARRFATDRMRSRGPAGQRQSPGRAAEQD